MTANTPRVYWIKESPHRSGGSSLQASYLPFTDLDKCDDFGDDKQFEVILLSDHKEVVAQALTTIEDLKAENIKLKEKLWAAEGRIKGMTDGLNILNGEK